MILLRGEKSWNVFYLSSVVISFIVKRFLRINLSLGSRISSGCQSFVILLRGEKSWNVFRSASVPTNDIFPGKFRLKFLVPGKFTSCFSSLQVIQGPLEIKDTSLGNVTSRFRRGHGNSCEAE